MTYKHIQVATDASGHEYKQFDKDANDFLRVIRSFYLFPGQNVISSDALEMK